jgi:GTP pyrophosphokinase
LRKHGLGLGGHAGAKALDAVAKEMNFSAGDDLVAAVGGGKVSAKQVATKVIKQLSAGKDGPSCEAPTEAEAPVVEFEHLTPPRSARRRRTGTGVCVEGIEDMLVRLSRCCTPVPGDEIIGFVTRGRGVSVHRADCPNARDLVKSSPERIIDVSWDTASQATYQVEIRLEALDRTGLLRDVTVALSEAGANIRWASGNTDKHGIANMQYLFELGNMDQLDRVINELKHIDGVFDAHRVMGSDNGKRKRHAR